MVVNKASSPAFRCGKRIFDLLGALLLLLAMVAPMGAIYLLLLEHLGRPTFFRQIRLGKDQERFTLYKFRTMSELTDDTGALLPDQERTSSLGRLLRRYRLDELPGLLNVLRGDLSLVGPRPLPPAVLAGLGPVVVERCAVRPGLTGWAQVNGNTLLANEEKMALDLWYVRNASFRLDIEILVKTADVLVRGERRNDDAIQKSAA